MSATGWVIVAGLVVVFAAAMPWLDRRFTAARGLRDLDRHLRATGGPWSARETTDGLGDLFLRLGPPEAPPRPACPCTGCALDTHPGVLHAIYALPARTPDHERP